MDAALQPRRCHPVPARTAWSIQPSESSSCARLAPCRFYNEETGCCPKPADPALLSGDSLLRFFLQQVAVSAPRDGLYPAGPDLLAQAVNQLGQAVVTQTLRHNLRGPDRMDQVVLEANLPGVETQSVQQALLGGGQLDRVNLLRRVQVFEPGMRIQAGGA